MEVQYYRKLPEYAFKKDVSSVPGHGSWVYFDVWWSVSSHRKVKVKAL